MFSLTILRNKELADKSKAPCNTCLYALTLTNDCEACHEPVDGKCEAYRKE